MSVKNERSTEKYRSKYSSCEPDPLSSSEPIEPDITITVSSSEEEMTTDGSTNKSGNKKNITDGSSNAIARKKRRLEDGPNRPKNSLPTQSETTVLAVDNSIPSNDDCSVADLALMPNVYDLTLLLPDLTRFTFTTLDDGSLEITHVDPLDGKTIKKRIVIQEDMFTQVYLGRVKVDIVNHERITSVAQFKEFIEIVQKMKVCPNATKDTLRTFMMKMEEDNNNLKGELQQMERDRADVIAYLKRRLGEKCEEIAELLERNHALVEEKKAENESFLEQLASKDREFKEVIDQLSAEIKLLNGKLSSLEEFREQKESLMAKYSQLEDKLRETEENAQEMEKHYEKTNLINKDRLRQEMEEKLLKLSLDFQRATQTRIDSTTQRVIKENIQISNELSALIKSWQILHTENEDLRSQTRHFKNEIATEKDLVERILAKNVALIKATERLNDDAQLLRDYQMERAKLFSAIQNLQKTVTNESRCLRYKEDEVRRLVQEKHNLKAQMGKIEEEYCSINRQAMICFKEIKLLKEMHANNAISKAEEQEKQEQLLTVLERLLREGSSAKELRRKIMAVLAVTVIGEKYKRGDLGIIEPHDDDDS